MYVHHEPEPAISINRLPENTYRTRQRWTGPRMNQARQHFIQFFFRCLPHHYYSSGSLDNLTLDNTVYELVEPVLVPQEQDEAKANVRTRLEFIKSEISLVGCETYQHHRKHVDAQIKNDQVRSGKRRTRCGTRPPFPVMSLTVVSQLVEIHTKFQQDWQPAANVRLAS